MWCLSVHLHHILMILLQYHYWYFNRTVTYLKHQLCTFMHVQFTPCVCSKDAKFATFKNIFMMPYLTSSRIKNSRDLRITWKLFLDNFKSWKTKRAYNTEFKKKYTHTQNKTKQKNTWKCTQNENRIRNQNDYPRWMELEKSAIDRTQIELKVVKGLFSLKYR